MKSKLFVGVLLSVIVVLVCGCSGKSGGPVDISGSGTLTSSDATNVDGSYADTRNVRATSDGIMTVELSSEAFDPYVVVYEGSSEGTWIGSNDDGGAGWDSYITFYATKGETYHVKFTSYAADRTGYYTYHIYDDNTRSAPMNDDTGSKPEIKPEEKAARK